MRVRCRKCKQKTEHDILASGANEIDLAEDDPGYVTADEKWRVLSCRVCNSLCFQLEIGYDDEDENGYTSISLKTYPDPSQTSEGVASYQLPVQVRKLYRETIHALNADAPTLAAIGFRALVEAICLEQGFRQGSLRERIDLLASKGIIPTNNAEYLHQHRLLGNEAAHEMSTPSKAEIKYALELLEHLLNTLYVVPRKLADLQRLKSERNAPS